MGNTLPCLNHSSTTSAVDESSSRKPNLALRHEVKRLSSAQQRFNRLFSSQTYGDRISDTLKNYSTQLRAHGVNADMVSAFAQSTMPQISRNIATSIQYNPSKHAIQMSHTNADTHEKETTEIREPITPAAIRYQTEGLNTASNNAQRFLDGDISFPELVVHNYLDRQNIRKPVSPCVPKTTITNDLTRIKNALTPHSIDQAIRNSDTGQNYFNAMKIVNGSFSNQDYIDAIESWYKRD